MIKSVLDMIIRVRASDYTTKEIAKKFCSFSFMILFQCTNMYSNGRSSNIRVYVTREGRVCIYLIDRIVTKFRASFFHDASRQCGSLRKRNDFPRSRTREWLKSKSVDEQGRVRARMCDGAAGRRRILSVPCFVLLSCARSRVSLR